MLGSSVCHDKIPYQSGLNSNKKSSFSVQVMWLKVWDSGASVVEFWWGPFPVLCTVACFVFSHIRAGTSGKEPTCQCRRHKRREFDPWVRKIPGERNGHLLWYSCLETPTEEPGGLQSMGSQRVGHDWSDFSTYWGSLVSLLTRALIPLWWPPPLWFYLSLITSQRLHLQISCWE